MKKPKGLHEYRFKANPEEKRFAKLWAKKNEESYLLAYLLWEGTQQGRPPEVPMREQVVAATVVQFFGSEGGRFFLAELGYEKKP